MKTISPDELVKELDRIAKATKKLEGTHNVDYNILFTKKFLNRYSDFNSVSEMFSASGYSVKDKADFNSIPKEYWNQFIIDNTRFSSWQKMLDKAVFEHTKKKLGL
jgi:hypothetical protein